MKVPYTLWWGETQRKIFIGLVGLFAALCSLELLRAAYAAFTWEKFTLFDYGIYTNMIWNSGHGDFFRVLMDRSYLKTHLSFTLALLGPLYRLWDHPFLLSFLQWLMLVAGGAVIGVTLHRRRVRGELTAAILFFYAAYPYSQSVILSEFHGVSTYLFLVPLLYACLVSHKRVVWLPLFLFLGLREDAFLIVLPMLLYFAVRDRWKAGYFYTLLALAYGALAITVLYPWINDLSLFARRSREIGLHFDAATLLPRAWALLWVFLPTLGFVRHRWATVLLFPSIALAVAMASNSSRQYQLQIHYPAAIMACLVVGMAEAAIAVRPRAADDSRSPWSMAISSWLVGSTLLAHIFIGFLLGGGRSDRIYRRVHPEGVKTLQAAGGIPGEGTLIVPWQLAGFVANRADLLTWRTFKEQRHRFDLVFSNLQLFSGAKARFCLRLMESGELGVRFFDGDNFILQRGFDTSRNEELRQARLLAGNTIRLANTHREAGSNIEVPGALSVRFWDGAKRDPLPLLAYGRSRDLLPGVYEARLRLRSAGPATESGHHWGMLSLHVPGRSGPIAESEIDRTETSVGIFRTQVLPFELKETTEVEPRIRAGVAPLWLDTIVFVPVEGG